MKRILSILCTIFTATVILSSCSLGSKDDKTATLESEEVIQALEVIDGQEIESFSYSYGSFVDGLYDYSVYTEDGKTILKAIGSSGIDLNVTCEVDASVLDDLHQIIVDNQLTDWNGFEVNDSNSCGGYHFALSAQYSGGYSISASGYLEYPENYDAVHEKIAQYLGDLAEEYAESVFIPGIKSFSYSYKSDAGDIHEYYAYEKDGKTYFEAFESEGEGQRISCEVEDSVLQELNEIIIEVDIERWEYYDSSNDIFSDGYSYMFFVEYKSEEDKLLPDMIFVKGYKQFPENYDAMHEKAVAYFESMVQQYSENDAIPTPDKDITSFSFAYPGSYYNIYLQDDGSTYLEAYYNNSDTPGVFCKLDASVWEYLKLMISFNDLSSWNGFDGWAEDTYDGWGFVLSVQYSDGTEISGQTYMEFPDNFFAIQNRLCYNLDNLVQQTIEEKMNALTEQDLTEFLFLYEEDEIGYYSYRVTKQDDITTLSVSRLLSEKDCELYEVDNATLESLQAIVSEYKIIQWSTHEFYYGDTYEDYMSIYLKYDSISFSTGPMSEFELYPTNYHEVREKLKTFFEDLVLEYSAEEVA